MAPSNEQMGLSAKSFCEEVVFKQTYILSVKKTSESADGRVSTCMLPVAYFHMAQKNADLYRSGFEFLIELFEEEFPEKGRFTPGLF